MKYHKTLGLTLLAGSILALGMEAAAEAGWGACSADIAGFCKDVKPGGGRIADCLREHEKDLSKDCLEQRTQAAEKRARRGVKHGKKSFGRGGDPDRQGFKGAWNKGNKGGGACANQFGRGFAVGFQRGFRMSAGPGGAKGGKGGLKTRRNKLAKVCAEDSKKLCGGVKPGGGRVRDCLQKNIGKLSDGCKARTEKIKERLEEKTAEKEKTL